MENRHDWLFLADSYRFSVRICRKNAQMSSFAKSGSPPPPRNRLALSNAQHSPVVSRASNRSSSGWQF